MGVGDFGGAAAGFAGVFFAGGFFAGGVVVCDAVPGSVEDGATAGGAVAAGVVGVATTGWALGAGVRAISSIQAEPWMRLPNSSLGLRPMQTRTWRDASPVAVQGMLTSVQGCVP